MASLMENLIDVLCRECEEYERLLQLSGEKKSVIVSGNLEKLQKITDEEQVYVGRVAALEKKRTEVTADIANVLNRDVAELTLPTLIQMMEPRPAERKKLEEVHDRLKTAVHGVQMMNEQNSELLANALEMVEFELNLLQAAKTAPETANYNKGAYSAGSTMGVSVGAFDAKQ